MELVLAFIAGVALFVIAGAVKHFADSQPKVQARFNK